MDKNQFTGIILAGGKSSRMGTDKGFLTWNNQFFVEILLNKLKEHFENILIIANNPDYKKFKIPLIKDAFLNKGPMVGLYTGLKNMNTDYGFFVPVDSPFISSNLITRMKNHIENYDAVIPRFNQKIYPLTGVYHQKCVSCFKEAIKNERLSVKLEIEKLNHTFVEFDSEFERDFLNFNTPEDLNILK